MNTSKILLSLVLAFGCSVISAEDTVTVDWEAKYNQLLEADPSVLKKIENGSATKEDIIQWMQRTYGGKGKATGKNPIKDGNERDVTAFQKKLDELLEAGKISKEDAANLLSTLSGQSAETGKAKIELKALRKQLMTAVTSGEMTKAEAIAKYKWAEKQQGLAALLDRLDERGRLGSTAVLCAGEFGRTPKINKNGGRDHWARAMCAIMAGGDIRGGQVIGETDGMAAEPSAVGYSPDDLAASFFSNIGILPDTEFQSNVGRPITLVRDGTPIQKLF